MATSIEKSSITTSALSKSNSGKTWDEMTMTWDASHPTTWDYPGISATGISKSSITSSSVAKS